MTDSTLYESAIEEMEWKPAGFWIRVGAALLDGLVLFPLSGLYLLILFGVDSLLLSLSGLIVAIVYKPLMEYKYGQTLGKMALGIQVTTEHGGALSLGQSIVRYLPWMIGNVISMVMIISLYADLDLDSINGFMALSTKMSSPNQSNLSMMSSLIVIATGVSIAADKEKRGIHDKLAKTRCVYAKS